MRSKAACDVLGLKLYVFGGLGAGKLPTLWALDMAKMVWSMESKTTAHGFVGARPKPRCSHTLTSDGNHRLFMFGGQGDDENRRAIDVTKEKKPLQMQTRMLSHPWSHLFHYA